MSYSLLQYMFINVLIFNSSPHFYPFLGDTNFFPKMSLLSTNRKPSCTKLFQLNFFVQITKFVSVVGEREKRDLKQSSMSYLLKLWQLHFITPSLNKGLLCWKLTLENWQWRSAAFLVRLKKVLKVIPKEVAYWSIHVGFTHFIACAQNKAH